MDDTLALLNQVESTAQSGDVFSPWASLNEEALWLGVVLPIGFLVLYTLIKHFAGSGNKDQGIWLSMVAELSIDLMSIMTSWIMTYFVLQKNGAVSAIVAVPLVCSMILAFTHSMWRNSIKMDIEGSNPHYLCDWLQVIAMVLISLGWLIIVINFYSRWIR